jgi:uncharacterized protein (TIGR02594 family)
MRRMNTALLGAAILALSFSAAEARPHHHQHHHYRHHHVRVSAAHAQEPDSPSFFSGFQSGLRAGFSAGSGVIERARSYLGETAHQVGVRSTLWCSAFMRKITGATDVDDRALSWERHEHIAPQVGAVVTMGRRGGGHVGVVSGFTKNGDPIVISGNGGGSRVTEHPYPRSRIRAWVKA